MESVSTGFHSRLQDASRSIAAIKTFISPAANQFSYCGTTALNPEATRRSSPDEGGGRDARPPLKPHSLDALPAWMRLLSVESKGGETKKKQQRRYPSTISGILSGPRQNIQMCKAEIYSVRSARVRSKQTPEKVKRNATVVMVLLDDSRATASNGAQLPLKRTIQAG